MPFPLVKLRPDPALCCVHHQTPTPISLLDISIWRTFQHLELLTANAGFLFPLLTCSLSHSAAPSPAVPGTVEASRVPCPPLLLPLPILVFLMKTTIAFIANLSHLCSTIVEAPSCCGFSQRHLVVFLTCNKRLCLCFCCLPTK